MVTNKQENPDRVNMKSPERVSILLPPGDERHNAKLVARILDRLRSDPVTRAPDGAPFYNEAIGVLSVPAPHEDPVGAVRLALRDVAEGLIIAAEYTGRTQ